MTFGVLDQFGSLHFTFFVEFNFNFWQGQFDGPVVEPALAQEHG